MKYDFFVVSQGSLLREESGGKVEVLHLKSSGALLPVRVVAKATYLWKKLKVGRKRPEFLRRNHAFTLKPREIGLTKGREQREQLLIVEHPKTFVDYSTQKTTKENRFLVERLDLTLEAVGRVLVSSCVDSNLGVRAQLALRGDTVRFVRAFVSRSDDLVGSAVA